MTAQANIETAKTIQLNKIASETNATIAELAKTYQTSIATSSGFGYLAASMSKTYKLNPRII